MELLQNKLRPTSLKDVLGQTHIIGKGKVLTNLVKEKKLFNKRLKLESKYIQLEVEEIPIQNFKVITR